MTHGSLFSGIGGFDLAAEWMEWENKFHCEWNPFGQKVLHYYWPKAEQFTDITKTDFTKYANRIDIISGGFPCQPYSSAGKRLGKEDSRHLWPQMLRAIREVSPRYVVGENVRGLTNWNGGMVFDEVQADLEAEGYEVTPFLLPACGVNAPHRRDRIWFVAYANSHVYPRGLDNGGNQSEERGSESENQQQAGRDENRQRVWAEFSTSSENVANAYSIERCKGGMYTPRPEETECNISTRNASRNEWNTWQQFPTQSPLYNGGDGLSERLDGITFRKWRAESIKAGGNAIVPQVALQIFKAIQQYELL